MTLSEPRRRFARFAVCPVLAVIVIGLLATPAFAHAELVGTTPGQGQTVATSPKSVSLIFSEQVEASLGSVRVYDGNAKRVDDGRTHQAQGGREVVTDLPHLADGYYVVTYRVVSADSHPVSGAFTFKVGTGDVTVDQSLVKRLFGAQGDDSTVAVVFGVTRIVEFLALAAFVGGLLVLAIAWPAGWALRRVRRLLVIGGVVGLLAVLLSIPLQGAKAGGFALADAFGWNLISEVLATRYGVAALVRVIAITAALALTFAPGAVRRWGAPALGVIGLVTLSFAGHASVASPAAPAVVIDALHLLGGAYWIGGLALLLFAVLRGTPETEDRGAVVVRITRGFLYAVALIVITGIAAAWREVGSLAALTETDFGRLLVGKIGVFLLMLALAVYGRNIVLRRWVYEYEDDPEDPDELAAVEAERGPLITETEDVRHLRRSVGIEACFAIIVFALTGLLVASVPAKQAYETSRSFQQNVSTADGSYVFDISVNPASIGPNDVHVTLTRANGSLVSVLDMSGEMDLEERDIAPIDLQLRRLGSAHYFSPGFSIPIAGRWRLTVRAQIDTFTEVSVAATVPVR